MIYVRGLLLTWFQPCAKEKATQFLNASQIAAKLAEKAKLNITDGTINKIGKALKKHQFVRLLRKGSPVYAVREYSWDEVEISNRKLEEEPNNNIPIVPLPPNQTDLSF
jgi:hypothetical protein